MRTLVNKTLDWLVLTLAVLVVGHTRICQPPWRGWLFRPTAGEEMQVFDGEAVIRLRYDQDDWNPHDWGG
jgi:hypothetical protein